MEILFQATLKITTGERVSPVCSKDVRGGGECLYDLGEGGHGTSTQLGRRLLHSGGTDILVNAFSAFLSTARCERLGSWKFFLEISTYLRAGSVSFLRILSASGWSSLWIPSRIDFKSRTAVVNDLILVELSGGQHFYITILCLLVLISTKVWETFITSLSQDTRNAFPGQEKILLVGLT